MYGLLVCYFIVLSLASICKKNQMIFLFSTLSKTSNKKLTGFLRMAMKHSRPFSNHWCNSVWRMMQRVGLLPHTYYFKCTIILNYLNWRLTEFFSSIVVLSYSNSLFIKALIFWMTIVFKGPSLLMKLARSFSQLQQKKHSKALRFIICLVVHC